MRATGNNQIKWCSYCGQRLSTLPHRHIMEAKLNKRLETYDFVHHKNQNRKDNRISNLQVMTPQEHAALHAKLRAPREKETIAYTDSKKIFIPVYLYRNSSESIQEGA